ATGARMRGRGGEKAGISLAGQTEIVAEAALAREQARVLLAADGTAKSLWRGMGAVVQERHAIGAVTPGGVQGSHVCRPFPPGGDRLAESPASPRRARPIDVRAARRGTFEPSRRRAATAAR